MRKLLFVISLLVLNCNEDPAEERNYQQDQAIRVLSCLKYYKDTRTNVCYATIRYLTGPSIITNVPCSEEVEKVAVKFTTN